MCRVFDSRQGYHFELPKRPDFVGAFFIGESVNDSIVLVGLIRSKLSDDPSCSPN